MCCIYTYRYCIIWCKRHENLDFYASLIIMGHSAYGHLLLFRYSVPSFTVLSTWTGDYNLLLLHIISVEAWEIAKFTLFFSFFLLSKKKTTVFLSQQHWNSKHVLCSFSLSLDHLRLREKKCIGPNVTPVIYAAFVEKKKGISNHNETVHYFTQFISILFNLVRKISRNYL